MKRFFHNLLLGLASVLVAVLLAEGLIRLVAPQQEAMRWHRSDERYGFVMKRNFYQPYHYINSDYTMHVRTNSLGLRDREYDLSRTDQKRVLLLGDSFTFGYAVDMDDNFDAGLEARLNATADDWAVINAGHGGWGTLQQLRYARDHFELFDPDVLVVTFCGNDPADDTRALYGMHDSEKGLFYFPGKVFIRNHSHLYRFLFNHFKLIVHNWTLRQKVEATDEVRRIALDEQSGEVISEDEWTRTLGYLRELHQAFRAHNPEGLMLLQASAPLNDDIRTHLQSLDDGHSLLYVDLADEVRRLEPEQRRLPYDGHWSPLMHAISAEQLFETLHREGRVRW